MTEETKAPPSLILISMFQIPDSDKTIVAISFPKTCMQACSSRYHSFQIGVSPFKAFSISALIQLHTINFISMVDNEFNQFASLSYTECLQ